MADRALRFDLLGRDRTLGRTLGQAEGRFKRLGSSALKVGTVIGGAFAGIGVASFIKGSVQAAATFDKTMRQVAAVTKIPTSQMKELRQVALDMGAKTSFSAAQASQAMLELGKGGLSFAQMKAGALSATLTLAAAGGLELGDAAGFVVQGLKTFGLRADKAANVAAALAGAANASTSSVEDMGLALSQTGAGARNAGLSIQETAGVLALFADNGVRGSDAGTSLKTMLARLVPQTEKARDAMKDLGLKFTDAHGAILPIDEIADQLRDKLGGLSDAQRTTALSTIFGSDATRAATILMRSGSRGLDRYIKATNDRRAAEELAKTNTQGAAGAFERFKGAIETVSIQIGDKLLPALAGIAEGLSKGITDAFKALEDSVDVQAFVATAKAWATVIISGFKHALKTGDWKPLGRILQDALGKAIGNGADLIRKAFGGVDWNELGRVIGEGLRKTIGNGTDLMARAFGGVDWHGVGKAIGSRAFGFAVGFVAALGSDLFTTAREHPFDTLVFFSSFLAVGKIGGVIAKLLSKVPFLRAFAPLFSGINKLTAPLNNAIGRVLRAMGSAFVKGLGLEGVQMGRAIVRRFDGLRLRVWLFGEAFARAALRLVEMLGRGIRNGLAGLGRAIAAVVAALARFLARLLGPVAAPFLRAGSNLLDRIVTGMRSRFGAISSTVTSTIARLVNPFRSSLRWLSRAGQNLVDGLISGMRSALGSIGGIIRSLKDAIVGGIKRLFGIRSPSTVMAGLGAQMVAGLVKGLISNQGTLGAILKSIGGDITEAFAGLGGGGGSAYRLVGFARAAFAFFRNMFPGMTIGGWRAQGSVPGSDHPKGKALDLMTTSGFVANAIISIFRAMPGAKYWIWNRQIATASGGWRARPYSGPSPHTDHVHLSFFKQGAWKLLEDQLGYLHKGEMVVPAGPAERIRQGGGGIDYDRLGTVVVAAFAQTLHGTTVTLDGQAVGALVVEPQFRDLRRILRSTGGSSRR